MKLLRVLLIIVMGAVVVVLGAVCVAFIPSVQTWAARRAVAAQPGMQVELGRVAVGFHRVKIERVVFKQEGMTLTLPLIEADLSLLNAGFNQKINLSRLVAKGWTLDLTTPSGNAATPPSALASAEVAKRPSATSRDAEAQKQAVDAFQGILNQVALPVDLQVEAVDVQGDVIFPSAGPAPGRASLAINGGGFGVGKDGVLTYSANVTLSDPDSKVNALAVQGNLAGRMDTPRTFSRLSFTLDASASGVGFPSGVKLSAEANAARVSGGETYGATVQSVGKKLFSLEANFPDQASKLGGVWKLDVRDVDIAPFALGQALPSFEAVGAGMFEATTRFDEFHVGGRVKSTADRLSVFAKQFDAVGALGINSDFDFTVNGSTLRVDALSATINGAAPVLSAQAKQPFEFNFNTSELKVANPAADLLGVSLQGLPLEWARLFLGEIAATGGDLRGELAASARAGGVSVRTTTPLTISKLSVVQAGQPVLRDLDVSIAAAGDYTPQGWQADITAVDLRSAGQALFHVAAKVGQLAGADQPIKASGQWKTDLPLLLAQPVMAGSAQLGSGKAQGDFALSLATKQEIQLKLLVDNLTSLTKEALPKISTDLRADIAADGKITLNVPLTLELNGRSSDLTITGTALKTEKELTLDGRINSTLLVLDDIKVLTVVLPAQPAPAAPTAPNEPAGRDTVPFWNGLSGQLSLAIKKAIYTKDIEVTDVTGTLKLEPGAIKFENVQAAIGQGGSAKISGTVAFDGTAKQPYAMNADLLVAGVDSGPLFRAVAPMRPPTIEGKFDASSKIASGGDNLDQLLQRANGDFQVSSKSGVFRALSADVSDRVSKNQSLISAGLGLITGRKEDDTAKTIADVAKYLSEIPFDQLSVTLSRGQSLDLNLKDFALISPEARIGGSGTIKHAEGKSILEQGMNLSLALGARGKLGEALKKIKLLDAKTDSLGYSAFTVPINIKGTAEKPDNSQLTEELLKAAIQAATGGGGNLLDVFGGKKS